jgi:plasmid rolling circle replication initiator protein Rep
MKKKESQGGKELNDKEVLRDVSESGKVRPWSRKKYGNTILAKAYDEINERKSERLRECANVLVFKESEDGRRKLENMSSCRVRLCPMCAWRRSMKVYANVMKVIDGMTSEKEYAFVYLTLTIRNVKGDELAKELDSMMEGFRRLTMKVKFKRAVKGFYRGLEVTHNVNRISEWYDSYHPHFHVLLAVNTSYFAKNDYLSHEKWRNMWREAMRIDYEPIVNVKRVKGNTAKAVSDAAAYTVKDDEYIMPEDWQMTIETIAVLDGALANRRLVSYGGIMRDWHKRLNLEDEMNGDLVHVDGDEPAELMDAKRAVYAWHTGYNQYCRV